MPLNPLNTVSMKQKMLYTNPQWRANIDRWKFLIDSYSGGQSYRDGKYLTAYQMESQEDYETRLDSTPYDNHVKAIIAIYNSFMFREPPKRELGNLANDSTLPLFLKDADLDGRSFESLMRDISTYASIYGNVWVILDKPPSNVYTRAEELNQGIRPYLSIVTPENVLDWQYERQPSGIYTLTYLKIFEGQVDGLDIFRTYTPDAVTVYSVSDEDVKIRQEFAMPLDKIPAVCVYGQRSPVKGIGISDVGDVADMCRSIYNELSEVEQLGRLTNHPSLVKTASTQAAAGAGSIIQMPEDLQADLKPYLLQPDGASIDGFLSSMKNKVECIDRMSHMGGIRSIETRRLSGIGLATEFQLLNAQLAAKADELEHAEEQLWRLYAQWQGVAWDGEVKYPDSFNIQDKYNDMNNLKLAKDAAPRSDIVHKVIEQQMLRLLVTEEEYEEIKDEVDVTVESEQAVAPAVESPQQEMEDQADDVDRVYPDGQPIPDDLPPAYQSSASDGVPEGQACGNCRFNVDQQCQRFNNAPIRESWWCLRWEAND